MHVAPPEVVNNTEHHQFEIRIGEDIARLSYRVRDRDIELIHTEVPRVLEGQGFANELAQAALEYAAREKLRVIPTCPFVRSYLRRHANYQKLTERTDD
jgi:predicted GNAT family acetyltransferase